MKRDDIRFIGLPNAIAGKIAEVFGARVDDYILPVLPKFLAKDNPSISKRFAKASLGYRRSSLTMADIEKKNQATFAEAAGFLDKGSVLTLFPAGSINSDIQSKWPNGSGEIIQRTTMETRQNLIVVPVHFEDDFSPQAFGAALLTKMVGKQPKKRTFTIHFGKPRSVSTLIDLEQDPQKISSILQDFYVQTFKSKKFINLLG